MNTTMSASLMMLLDASLRCVLLFSLAGVVCLLLRNRSAALCHGVWTTAVVLALLLPALSAVLPSWRLSVLPDVVAVTTSSEPLSEQPIAAPSFDQNPAPRATTPTSGWRGSVPPPSDMQDLAGQSPARQIEESSAVPTVADVETTSEATSLVSSHSDMSVSTWILLIWAGGVAVMLISMLIGTAAIRRVARQSRHITDPAILSMKDRLCEELAIRQPVLMLQSDDSFVPVTWGVWWPTVLLPCEAKDWPSSRLRMVLLHELAHVQRGDCLTQLLVQLARTMYWFHPLIWWAAKNLRIQRERACDDLVLTAGVAGPDYADQLLQIVRSLRSGKGTPLAAVAMARRSQFESRLLSVLDTARRRTRLSRKVAWAILAAALAIALPLAALQPVARAQKQADGITRPASDQEPGKSRVRQPEASQYPQVVKTSPAALANDVDPRLSKITVTFDRPMMDGSWSWTGGGETYPKVTGKIHYDPVRKTCTLPVKLQPGKVYWVGINSPSHNNFKTVDRKPAKRYVILFATKSASGKNTPIPADLLNHARQINAAAVPLLPASDADKRKAENVTAKGWNLWRQRKLSEAEELFQQAVKLDPANTNAWNGLGWSQFNQGKPMNAKQSFEVCVKLAPQHAAALNGLGWIAKGQGKTDEAIAYWTKAVEAAPAATAALNGLTQTYMEQKKYDEAIQYYEMWLKAEPNNADAKKGIEKAKTELKKQRPWSVVGRVTDAEGKGMEGVTIRAATGVETLLGHAETKTDSQGRYTLYFYPGWRRPGDKADQCELQVASIYAGKEGMYEKSLCRQGALRMAGELPPKDNRWKATPENTILPNKPFRVDFVLLPAAGVKGQLVDEKGKPIAKAFLYLNGNDRYPSTGVLRGFHTDEQGRFQLSEIPLRPYWFTLKGQNNSELNAKPIHFTVPKTHEVKLICENSPSNQIQLKCELLSVSPAQTENDKAVQIATKETQRWLKVIDAKEYEQSWKEMAAAARAMVTKEQWVKDAGFLKEFGPAKSRKLISSEYTTTIPGGPNGEYVILQYRTEFENKKQAVETVTPMKDKDGTWRVSGYYVK